MMFVAGLARHRLEDADQQSEPQGGR